MADTLVASCTDNVTGTILIDYQGNGQFGGVQWNSASESFSVTKIIAMLYRSGDGWAQHVWARIYNDNAGVPGTLIGSSNQTEHEFHTLNEGAATEITFTFDTPVALALSSKYYFCLYCEGVSPDFTGTIGWKGDSDSPADFTKWLWDSVNGWVHTTSTTAYIKIYKAEGGGTPINIALAVGGS